MDKYEPENFPLTKGDLNHNGGLLARPLERSEQYRTQFGSNFSFHLTDVHNRTEKKQLNGDTEYGHENPKKVKRVRELNEKIRGYIDGFTVHGLTRVLTAPRKESAFWFITLASALLMAVIVVQGLMSKYYRHEVYTEIRSIVTDKNRFPSISFCEFNLLKRSYFAYCGGHIKAANNVTCNLDDIPVPQDVNHTGQDYWSNGMFEIRECITWGHGKCVISELVQSKKDLNHSCFTWNYEGTFHDMYSHVTLIIEFKKPSWMTNRPHIIAVPHDSKIKEIDMTMAIDLNKQKKNQLTMGLTQVQRKEAPFPSKCINGGRDIDLLPGIYARRTCAETQIHTNIFKKCGDTTDYMRPYIQNAVSPNRTRFTNMTEVTNCIYAMSENLKATSYSTGCPFPCRELEIATFTHHAECDEDTERYISKDNDFYYQVELQLQNVDSYKIMEEKEMYPWDQMACEIGGFLGLVMGASMLSMIEIIACTWFYGIKRGKYGGKNEG
ncbi:acid-sensing ion channel 5-like [Clytia hemisphaerica]|uniref:Uncharacterized protein n=1 Tax=Clytia hemisphaerica TaxID=252671 RepID=A0A7M5V2M4_9CNID|eukprot:TCONS_00063460-protein